MGKTSSLKTILEQIKLLQKDKKIRLVITMAAVLLSAFILGHPGVCKTGRDHFRWFFRCGHADRTCGKLKRTDYSHAGDNDPFKYPGSSYVLSWDQCPVYSGVTASGRIWKYIFADIFISAYFYR